MSAITGIMLSDGHIALRTLSSNARFAFNQSGKPEKLEYFNLVFNLMKPFCTLNYLPYFQKWEDKRRNNATYTSISLTTMQLPCFTKLRHIWYKKGIKIVPLNIQELLTPIALAHWIMGDGSKLNLGLHLSVYAFSSSDVDLLVKALTNRYKLVCTIHNTKNGPRIYINKNSTDIVRSIVLPHLVPSMYYKLNI